MMETAGLTLEQVRTELTKKSGLFGLSGVSSDLRDIEAAADAGNDRARLAIDVLAYEVKKYIGAYAAAMGGLDAVAFAGGIGENSSRVRDLVCRDMAAFGIALDPSGNGARSASDRLISTADSRVSVLVVYTNEELVVARESVKVLGG